MAHPSRKIFLIRTKRLYRYRSFSGYFLTVFPWRGPNARPVVELLRKALKQPRRSLAVHAEGRVDIHLNFMRACGAYGHQRGAIPGRDEESRRRFQVARGTQDGATATLAKNRAPHRDEQVNAVTPVIGPRWVKPMPQPRSLIVLGGSGTRWQDGARNN